jgi:hypothetical protein
MHELGMYTKEKLSAALADKGRKITTIKKK